MAIGIPWEVLVEERAVRPKSSITNLVMCVKLRFYL